MGKCVSKLGDGYLKHTDLRTLGRTSAPEVIRIANYYTQDESVYRDPLADMNWRWRR